MLWREPFGSWETVPEELSGKLRARFGAFIHLTLFLSSHVLPSKSLRKAVIGDVNSRSPVTAHVPSVRFIILVREVKGRTLRGRPRCQTRQRMHELSRLDRATSASNAPSGLESPGSSLQSLVSTCQSRPIMQGRWAWHISASGIEDRWKSNPHRSPLIR